MAPTLSQISDFLREARKAAGFKQITAAPAAGVGYGVVTNSEQSGDVMASNFIALVMTYGAEEALVKQIREWRAESRQSNGAATLAANHGKGGTRTLPRAPLKPIVKAKSDQEKRRPR